MLDKLIFGIREMALNGVKLVTRKTVNIVASGATVTDDVANDTTTITLPGGGGSGLTPSGVQYSFAGEFIAGTISLGRISQDMILPAFAISSFAKTAPNTNTLLYERGATVTGITASASYSSAPSSASVANALAGSTNGGDVAPGSWNTVTTPFTSCSMTGSVKRNGADGGADPTMTCTLTAVGATTKTSSFQIKWVSRAFWGVAASGATSESDIEGLAFSGLDGVRARTFTVTASAQKVFYWYPDDLGAATFTVNGFVGGMSLAGTTLVTNAFGVQRLYRGYESDSLITGSVTVVVS